MELKSRIQLIFLRDRHRYDQYLLILALGHDIVQFKKQQARKSVLLEQTEH